MRNSMPDVARATQNSSKFSLRGQATETYSQKFDKKSVQGGQNGRIQTFYNLLTKTSAEQLANAQKIQVSEMRQLYQKKHVPGTS